MVYLATIVLFFSLVQMVVATINLFQNKPFVNLPFAHNSFVSILIPARDEARNIANILQDLLEQDYSNFEILVFNDQSTDNTEEIVTCFAKQDSRIKVMPSNGLPEGWLGKNYACYRMSRMAEGDFLLFLDADVRVNRDIISNAIGYVRKYNLGLLSIFPKQYMSTVGEWLAVPNMNFILLSLLPLVFVRATAYPSLAAANGQFMLFDAKRYFEMNPHDLLKASKVEDIEIARLYKKNNIPVACLAGDDTLRCRMYDGFSSAVNGFSKNVIHFFGNSFLMAFTFWLITTFGFVLIWIYLPVIIYVLFLITITTTRVFISIVSRQNIGLNLILLIPQQLALGFFIFKAFLNTLQRKVLWKGRNVS